MPTIYMYYFYPIISALIPGEFDYTTVSERLVSFID